MIKRSAMIGVSLPGDHIVDFDATSPIPGDYVPVPVRPRVGLKTTCSLPIQ